MINKIKTTELDESNILNRVGEEVILVNKLPHNTYVNEKAIIIENPFELTEKLLSVSVGVNRSRYSVLYVVLLIEMIEIFKAMNHRERTISSAIISRKLFDFKQMIPKVEKRRMQLFVPEKTLEDIQNLFPNIYKIHLIPALIDYAIDLKQQSGNVYLFECNQEGEHYEN